MKSQSIGWALALTDSGQRLLFTRDGGLTWADRSPRDLSESFKSGSTFEGAPYDPTCAETFCDDRNGFLTVITARGFIFYRTTDAGMRWSQTNIVNDEAASVFVSFLDRNHGSLLVTGDPAAGLMAKFVYTTRDGGRRWHMICEDENDRTEQVLGVGNGDGPAYPNGIVMQSLHRVFTYGSWRGDEMVSQYRSDNSGRSWEPTALAVKPGYHQADTEYLCFSGLDRRFGSLITSWNANNGTQNQDAAGSYLYRTEDGGRDWQRYARLPVESDSNYSVSFCSSANGWILNGDGDHLYHTEDAGRRWQSFALGSTKRHDDDNTYFSQIDAVSKKLAWILVYMIANTRDSGAADEVFLRTSDGGRQWSRYTH